MKTSILKALVGALLIFPFGACGADETPMDRSNIAVSYFYDYAELVGTVTDCADSDICTDGLLVHTEHRGVYYVPAEMVIKVGTNISIEGPNVLEDVLALPKGDDHRREQLQYTSGEVWELLEYLGRIPRALAELAKKK